MHANTAIWPSSGSRCSGLSAGAGPALPARTPAYPVRLPELPHGLQLTEVTFAPGVMCLAGSVPQWRVSVSTKRLDDILGQLGAAGRTLNLSGIARLR